MGPDFLFFLSCFFVLIAASFIFSLAETAFTATSIARIHRSSTEKGYKKYRTLSTLLKNKEDLISTILIGNNIVNIVFSSFVAYYAMKQFPDNGFALQAATIVSIVVIIIVCEVLPKSMAINYSESIALLLAPFFTLVKKMLFPILIIVKTVNNTIYKIIPIKNGKTPVISVYEVLKNEIDFFHDTGSVVKNDRDMLDGVLELNDTEVESIMTPKKNVYMFDLTNNPNEIVDLILSCGHTRIPIYKNNRDEVIGILNTKDLLRVLRDKNGSISTTDIEAILFQPYFISFNTKLKKQLFEFKKSRNHLAIIVDEYGSMIGVLTLEDIIEEIVGNIEDEHDSKAIDGLTINDDGTIIVRGDYQIRDFNKNTDLSFSHDDYSTVAGLVIHKAERIPNEGEIFQIDGHTFEIIQKKGAKITAIKIKLTKENQEKH